MKTHTPLRHLVIGCALLLGAFSASALTLGRVRGAALIGRPLNVVIQVTVDAGEGAGSVCPEADVFQGDLRMEAGRVTAEVIPGASATEFGVRLRTTAVIEEPVVTVYLRAGCGTKSTRRYVLLADIPAEPAAAVNLPLVAAAPVVPRVAVPAPAGPAPAAPSSSSSAAPAGAAATTTAPGVSAPAVARAPVPVSAKPAKPEQVRPEPAQKARKPEKSAKADKPAKAGKPATRSRLKLEPLDLSIEHDPVLRSSTELLSAPTTDETQRKHAAALWQALNARPEDVLRDTQRLDALQAEMQALQRAGLAKDAALGEVRSQLMLAQDQRYANGLVYALAALLLLLAGLAGYLWHRWRKADANELDWWQSPEAFRGVPEERDWGSRAATANAPAAPRAGAEESDEVDLDLGLNDSVRLPLPPEADVVPARFRGAPSDYPSSLPGSARAVNVEELFDIQQQADFFMSLDQHEQAIEVLRNHISENVETSALAYLDLLKIYHATDRKDDYAHLRDDFNKVFNAQVPQFDAFSDKGSGLEVYQNAMARVEALWPSAKVLEIIEESIFRKPGQGGSEAFDLEAYRELLLLYAIAKDIVDQGDSVLDFDLAGGASLPALDPGLRPSFSETSIQPLSTETRKLIASGKGVPTAGGEVVPELDATTGVSARMGLDIDLTEPAAPSSAFMEIGLESRASERPEHSGPPADAWGAPPATDSGLIDFDLFDAATERDIAPKRSGEPKK